MTLPYSSAARELQDRFDTRRLADRLVQVTVHDRFTADDRAFIEQRDMFFLASVDATGQPTCSYKGGDPGFVRVVDDRTLVFPNYDGNGMFLSMGNLAATHRVGLLFIDFETGDCLHLAVHASIAWDAAQVAAVPGALRLLRLEVVQVRRVPAWLPLQWGAAEMSPHLP